MTNYIDINKKIESYQIINGQIINVKYTNTK
jgi:hypothetical protein